MVAWYARPLNSRNGRLIRRASATPCSRCGSASASRGGPDLGGAEAHQRQRAQVLAQARPRRRRQVILRRVRGLGRGPQPPRLLSHRPQVPPLPGQRQPDHPEQHPHLPAPPFRHRRRPPLGHPQVPLRRLQRPPRQLHNSSSTKEWSNRQPRRPPVWCCSTSTSPLRIPKTSTGSGTSTAAHWIPKTCSPSST